MTKIEWTDRTWNPVAGCSLVSPGCTNCYAMKIAHVRAGNPKMQAKFGGLTQMSKAGPVWTGKVHLYEPHLLEPMSWRKPQRVFVNSMSDLFHEGLSDDEIDRVFAVMALSPQHTFQVLTKRAERMRSYFADEFRWAMVEGAAQAIHAARTGEDPSMWLAVHGPLANVWLGVSVEDQCRADERVPHLLQTPAAVRFLSCEPLLGPVAIHEWLTGAEENGIDMDAPVGSRVGACVGWRPPIDWVIAGGESGPGARAMHSDWPRSLRDQCTAAGVPFFFKQWGDHEPIATPGQLYDMMSYSDSPAAEARDNRKRCEIVFPDGRRVQPGSWDWWDDQDWFHDHDGDETSLAGCPLVMRRVGKKVAGRNLDGRAHDAFPQVRA